MIDRFEAVLETKVPYKQIRVAPELLNNYMPPSVTAQFPLVISNGDESSVAQVFADDTILDNRIHLDPITAHNIGVSDGEKVTVSLRQGTVQTADSVKIKPIIRNFDDSNSGNGNISDEEKARIYRAAKRQINGEFVIPEDEFAVQVEGIDNPIPLTVDECRPDNNSDIYRVAEDSRLELELKENDDVSDLDSTRNDSNLQIENGDNMSIKNDTQQTDGRQTSETNEVTYESIGGLHDEIEKVREMVEQPLQDPEAFQGVPTPSGVLLYGPPGTGKTMLAKAVANEVNAAYYSLSGAEIFDKNYGESEGNLRKLFEEAKKNKPAIIFIDEMEALVPPRNALSGNNQVEKRVVTQLKTLMDGFDSESQVIVLGATNHPEEIDDAFLRPGRFDRMIEVGVPNSEERREILDIHTRSMKIKFDDDFYEELVEETTGYTGADISDLCTKANMYMQRRILREYSDYADEISVSEILKSENDGYKEEDFRNALDETKPSLLKRFDVNVPEVKWSDIGGNRKVKERLREQVDGPLKAPNLWSDEETSTGILLFGPPGTGKTMLAKAMATESNRVFIGVQATELRSKWAGETERKIRQLFSLAEDLQPSILYIDEIESIAQPRDTSEKNSGINDVATSQLLSELDGIEDRGNVIVVGSTNAQYNPEKPLHRQKNVQCGLDDAILRPGRLEVHFHVPKPSREERQEIFRIHLDRVSSDDIVELHSEIDVQRLAEKTENSSGADIEGICWEAKHIARNKVIQNNGGLDNINDVSSLKISQEDLNNAIRQYTEASSATTTRPNAFH